MGHDKVYVAELHFGCRTDTLDSYGACTARKQTDRTRLAARLEAACKAFLGEQMQTPPAYSAVKVDGKKSYELARRGIDLPKPPRRVCISDIEVLAQTGPGAIPVAHPLLQGHLCPHTVGGHCGFNGRARVHLLPHARAVGGF